MKNGHIIRPIIAEFRSEYDKWTVMRMKAKLRECEEYISVFRDGYVEGREREVRKTRVMKLKEEIIQKERQQERTVWQKGREVSQLCGRM